MIMSTKYRTPDRFSPTHGKGLRAEVAAFTSKKHPKGLGAAGEDAKPAIVVGALATLDFVDDKEVRLEAIEALRHAVENKVNIAPAVPNLVRTLEMAGNPGREVDMPDGLSKLMTQTLEEARKLGAIIRKRFGARYPN